MLNEKLFSLLGASRGERSIIGTRSFFARQKKVVQQKERFRTSSSSYSPRSGRDHAHPDRPARVLLAARPCLGAVSSLPRGSPHLHSTPLFK
jgi:hypothetical protein